jgi:hypothetical protein
VPPTSWPIIATAGPLHPWSVNSHIAGLLCERGGWRGLRACETFRLSRIRQAGVGKSDRSRNAPNPCLGPETIWAAARSAHRSRSGAANSPSAPRPGPFAVRRPRLASPPHRRLGGAPPPGASASARNAGRWAADRSALRARDAGALSSSGGLVGPVFLPHTSMTSDSPHRNPSLRGATCLAHKASKSHWVCSPARKALRIPFLNSGPWPGRACPHPHPWRCVSCQKVWIGPARGDHSPPSFPDGFRSLMTDPRAVVGGRQSEPKGLGLP